MVNGVLVCIRQSTNASWELPWRINKEKLWLAKVYIVPLNGKKCKALPSRGLFWYILDPRFYTIFQMKDTIRHFALYVLKGISFTRTNFQLYFQYFNIQYFQNVKWFSYLKLKRFLFDLFKAMWRKTVCWQRLRFPFQFTFFLCIHTCCIKSSFFCDNVHECNS